MRHFPRTARRRVAAASLAAAMAVGALNAPQANADPLKDRKHKVEKQIRSAQSELESSSARMRAASVKLSAAKEQLSGAKLALAAAEAKVATAQQRDLELQAELDAAVAALEQAQADLAEGRVQMRDQQDQVAATITEMYQQGDPELLAFAAILDSQTPADLTRQTEMRDAIVDREDRVYQELSASKVILKVTEEQVEQAKEAVAVKREQAAVRLAEMQALQAEAEQAKAAVAAMVGERRTAQQSAAQARRADQAQLAKLRKQESRISAMLRRRALAALRRQQRSSAAVNTGGFLDPPVRGAALSSPYGYRSHPIYGYWGLHDGQDWAVDCGAPLYASASGRVVSSYFSPVYGRRLVIDHGVAGGAGIATIYNHASRYTVGVGSQVSRGEVIGYVGNTGWSTGCHLHYTVMANGRTVDPRNWM